MSSEEVASNRVGQPGDIRLLNNDDFTGNELEWLINASTQALGQIIAGQDIGIELNELARQFKKSGDDEALVSKASGVVGLVAADHVWEGTLPVRAVFISAPAIIRATAAAKTESSYTFTQRLAETVSAFCQDFGTVKRSSSTTKSEHPSVLRRPIDMTRNQLAVQAQHGDRNASEELFSRYERVARKIITRTGFHLLGGDEDDLCQVGLLGLANDLNKYDPDRIGFNSFAELVITTSMLDALKAERRDKREILAHTVSLDFAEVESMNDGHLDIDERYIYKELLAGLIDRLSRQEYSIVALFVQGFSYQEIANDFGCDVKTVDNALQRAKRKLSPLKN
jgi:RNA polymerase sporulation-specific sigma factor